MSTYLVKGKGWRYDFTLNKQRYTKAGFKTEKAAKQAEAIEKLALQDAATTTQPVKEIPTGMAFLSLLNLRLDYIREYNSEKHYIDSVCLAKMWAKQWGKLKADQITTEAIERYLLKRKRETSGYTANKTLRYLRALFNFAKHPKRRWIENNPTDGIEFFPVEKRIKYVPPKEDFLKLILAADPDTQDYLWTIACTMGRMGEINRLTWNDVNFDDRYVVLYTRKKRGGHLTPRKVPMTDKLYDVLSRRYNKRDKRKPWVFWHRYWSRKSQKWVEGPYGERKRFMKTLCDKAGVEYFRFHALRHLGATLLDQENVPLGTIQRILGHQNRSTTEIYLHSLGNADRDAIKIFDNLFGEKSHTESHTDEMEQNKKLVTY